MVPGNVFCIGPGGDSHSKDKKEESLLDSLGINLKVVVVQIIAFILVVYILNKFLFGRILQFLKTREDSIKNSFEDITKKQQDADKLMQEYKARITEIEKEAHVKMQEAVQEGLKLKTQIIEQARHQAQEDTKRAHESIKMEKEKAIIELRQQVISLTLQATEKILGESVDEALQTRLVDKYINDLDVKK